MTDIPLPFAVDHCAYLGTGEDSHGNQIPTWAEPVAVGAFWWTPSSSEPVLAGHDRVVVDLVLVVDSSIVIGARDRVLIEGQTWEVIGVPEDFDHGPFGFRPNRRPVNLRKVDG